MSCVKMRRGMSRRAEAVRGKQERMKSKTQGGLHETGTWHRALRFSLLFML